MRTIITTLFFFLLLSCGKESTTPSSPQTYQENTPNTPCSSDLISANNTMARECDFKFYAGQLGINPSKENCENFLEKKVICERVLSKFKNKYSGIRCRAEKNYKEVEISTNEHIQGVQKAIKSAQEIEKNIYAAYPDLVKFTTTL